MTKKQECIYNRYLNSTDYELRHVYGRWSDAKENAMDYCKSQMYKRNGNCLRIISHNAMVFTVGFTFTDEDGSEKFMYITRDNDYIWNL